MKRCKLFLFFIAAISLAAFILAGCPAPDGDASGSEANPFIGTWINTTVSDGQKAELEYVFFANMTAESYGTVSSSVNQTTIFPRTLIGKGTYTLGGNAQGRQTLHYTSTYVYNEASGGLVSAGPNPAQYTFTLQEDKTSISEFSVISPLIYYKQ